MNSPTPHIERVELRKWLESTGNMETFSKALQLTAKSRYEFFKSSAQLKNMHLAALAGLFPDFISEEVISFDSEKRENLYSLLKTNVAKSIRQKISVIREVEKSTPAYKGYSYKYYGRVTNLITEKTQSSIFVYDYFTNIKQYSQKRREPLFRGYGEYLRNIEEFVLRNNNIQYERIIALPLYAFQKVVQSNKYAVVSECLKLLFDETYNHIWNMLVYNEKRISIRVLSVPTRLFSWSLLDNNLLLTEAQLVTSNGYSIPDMLILDEVQGSMHTQALIKILKNDLRMRSEDQIIDLDARTMKDSTRLVLDDCSSKIAYLTSRIDNREISAELLAEKEHYIHLKEVFTKRFSRIERGTLIPHTL